MQARPASHPVIVKSAAEFAAIVANNPFVPPRRRTLASSWPSRWIEPNFRNSSNQYLQPGERLAVTERCLSALLWRVLESKAGAAILGKSAAFLEHQPRRNWGQQNKLTPPRGGVRPNPSLEPTATGMALGREALVLIIRPRGQCHTGVCASAQTLGLTSPKDGTPRLGASQ